MMAMGVRLLCFVLIGGWLADVLASTDRDVEAGIEAYEAGNFDEALTRFEQADQRLGQRPEISFDRGLALLGKADVEGARSAFERASESSEPQIRASAFYELGNLAMEEEAWELAIEHYIDALEARPDHANAKWNLELALRKKQEQEEEEQEQEEQEQEEQEQEDQEQDQEEQEEEEQDKEEQDKEEQEQEEQEQEEQEQEQEQEQDQDQDQDQDQGQEQQGQEQQEQEQQEQQPQAIDEMDLEKALQQLDQQDPFALDKPVGGYVQPEKDW